LIPLQKVYKFKVWSASSFKENPLEVTDCLWENGFKPTLGICISFQLSTSHSSKILFWSCHPLPCNLQPWPIFKKFITKIGHSCEFFDRSCRNRCFCCFWDFFWKFRNLKTSPSCYWWEWFCTPSCYRQKITCAQCCFVCSLSLNFNFAEYLVMLFFLLQRRILHF